jgi:GT2 family glycosyltransferase
MPKKKIQKNLKGEKLSPPSPSMNSGSAPNAKKIQKANLRSDLKKNRQKSKKAPPAAVPTKPTEYLPLPKARSKAPEISLLRRMEHQFEKALERPKVSVIIVNHDGVDFLWHCLFALKTQNYPPTEIILVDNASQDASVSFVQSNYPQVKVMECQENFGFAMGCNLGAKYATGDLVALLNNDAVVTPDWLSRLVKEFQEGWPKAGAISSLVKSNAKSEQVEEGFPKDDHLVLNLLGKPVEGFFADPRTVFGPSGCAFIYARFLAADGPFDSDYFILQEDVYFGWRLRQLGSQVRRSLTAKVFHEEGGTLSRFPQWKAAYYKTRNRWLNLFLFYETGNLLKLSPWLAADILGGQALSFLSGLDAFLGHGLALAWILTHPFMILAKRQALQRKRKTGDEEILKYLSGRVSRDKGFLSRIFNFLSLAYCGVVGLEVLESQEETRHEN